MNGTDCLNIRNRAVPVQISKPTAHFAKSKAVSCMHINSSASANCQLSIAHGYMLHADMSQ